MSDWIQVEIKTTTAGIEPVAAVLLNMGLGYAVQDAADFEDFLEGKNGYWDYIDEQLLELRNAPTIVTVYLSDQKQGVDQLAEITRELDRLQFMANNEEWGDLTYTLSGIAEEQWATAWKQYYHPITISPRLTICPEWVEYSTNPGEKVVMMDPGMAFGTGTHESTKLCLQLLDEHIQGGERVLDIGTGSGILAISAIRLGAKEALAIDIDAVAVSAASKNAKLNDIGDNMRLVQGSFAAEAEGRYDIIFANIVADAIITLAPEIPSLLAENAIFITSGIIDTRAEEVAKALEESGLVLLETKEERGWVAYCARAKEN